MANENPSGGNTIISSKNVNAGSIDAEGNVSIGDTIVTNIYYSCAYQDLKKQEEELTDRFNETKKRAEKYPDDDSFTQELYKIDKERSEVKKKIEALKQEVLKLAEDFTRIPLNTERLRLAKAHFEAGAYDKARAILDAEKMGEELDALLSQKEYLAEKQTENAAHLTDKANEYLILARLTAFDFSLPNRFEKTKEYFEASLKASRTEENLFAYAYFLQNHNQFGAAQPLYEELLEIYRKLSEANPEAYLPYVATTLNNLANLQSAKNELGKAEASYGEALGIYRKLSEANPEAYLPDVAMTAVNLSIFYLQSKPEKEKSLALAEEAFLAAAPFAEVLPVAKHYATQALQVVQAWEEDVEGFIENAIKKLSD